MITTNLQLIQATAQVAEFAYKAGNISYLKKELDVIRRAVSDIEDTLRNSDPNDR